MDEALLAQMQERREQGLHGKYGYNGFEKSLMVLFTGITNFWGIPSLFSLWERKKYYQFFMGLLTMITSFMYHFMDSIDLESFFFDEGHWHRIDNLCAITGIIGVIVEFYGLDDSFHAECINMASFFIILILQEGYPWNLEYTLVPLMGIIIVLIIRLILNPEKMKSTYNMKAIKWGTLQFFIGVLCFTKGLDEHEDYLRFFHGLWHLFITWSIYYVLQVKVPRDKPVEEFFPHWKQIIKKIISLFNVSKSI